MVRITVLEEDRLALWVDGYFPDHRRLRHIAETSFSSTGTREYNYGELVQSVCEELFGAAVRTAEERDMVNRNDPGPSDVYYVRPWGNWGELGSVSPIHVIADLVVDLESEAQNPQYAALLFSCAEHYWPGAAEAANDIINTVQLVEKPAAQYADLDGLTRFAESLLDRALISPYQLPSAEARRELRSVGLHVPF